MRILGIETSCDETAAAVVEITEQPSNRTTQQRVDQSFSCSVLSNVVASQIKIHAKTGGVVPEVAARAHVEKIIPVVEKSLEEATKRLSDGAIKSTRKLNRLISQFTQSLDCIAVTAGPGLVTSLLVGVEVARTLSWLWKKPVVVVNHLAGHVYANWLPSPQPSPAGRGGLSASPLPLGEGQGEGNIKFPLLCLIVSGGHTELVLMRRHLDFKVIGATRDDAAGEAFDKVAKMLNLRYPGGPEVARFAEQFTVNGSQSTVKFPRPMIDQKGDFSAKGGPAFGWDFSFSGLKTAVLYYIKEHGAKNKEQICYEFQEAVVDVLVAKTVRAAKKYNVKTVLLGGGVAANQRLRTQLFNAVSRELPTVNCELPSVNYTTDNAAMIAVAGYFMAVKKQYTPWQKLDVDPNWQLGKKLTPLPR